MEYDLRHETRHGRCAWCWRRLGDTETHTAVEPRGQPSFDGRPLRFHHPCWQQYMAVAGPGWGKVAKGRRPEWPPEKIERLRIHAGMTANQFRRHLHCSQDRFLAIMGDSAAPPPWLLRRLSTTAAAFRFEHVSAIDWTRPATVHSLMMSLGMTRDDLTAAVGVAKQSVQRWLTAGVPAPSLRAHNRLGQLAANRGFTAADVVAAVPWTAAEITAAIAASGVTKAEWVLRTGIPAAQLKEMVAGRVRMSRDVAWKFTREAIRRGLPVPEKTDGPDPWARVRKGVGQREGV